MAAARNIFDDPDRKRDYNRTLFTTVAPRYDLVTRLLSFGRDGAWKRHLISGLPAGLPSAPLVVDLACGTGDLTLALAARYPGAAVAGIDLNAEMLAIARRRAETAEAAPAPGAAGAGGAGGVRFIEGDMQALPFADGSVAIVTGGYALRNAPDLAATLSEIRRVLAPGGAAAFLEFSHSHHRPVAAVQLALLRFWGRLWGRILHRDPEVYGYIAASLAVFPDLQRFEEELRRAGFSAVRSRRYMFGLLAITQARG